MIPEIHHLSSDELKQYTRTFWPVSEQASATLEIDDPDWPNIIGYLPHFYFGLDGNFDFDADYWLLPDSAKEDYARYLEKMGPIFTLPEFGEEEATAYPEIHKWRRHIREKLLEMTEGTTRLRASWDENGNTLQFNEEPYNVFIQRLTRIQTSGPA